MTDDEIKKRADEAEAGYDVEKLTRRGLGGQAVEPNRCKLSQSD